MALLQCTKVRACKWFGQEEDLVRVLNSKETKELGVKVSDNVCPKCGNKTMYEIAASQPQDICKELGITDHERQLLQHMLGADSRYMKKEWGFRNRYCASDYPECKDRLALEAMEERGLVKSGVWLGNKTFRATKLGALAIGFKPYQLAKTDLANG